MANIGTVLRDEISRLSRRELRKLTDTTRRATAQHRHHIAALNRKVAQLERQVAGLTRVATRQQQTTTTPPTNGGSSTKLRFASKGVRSHRRRLGLSAADFGKLVGVTANSVYAWESGATIPRQGQLAKIAALRTVGTREAVRRLEAARAMKSIRPRRKE